MEFAYVAYNINHLHVYSIYIYVLISYNIIYMMVHGINNLYNIYHEIWLYLNDHH